MINVDRTNVKMFGNANYGCQWAVLGNTGPACCKHAHAWCMCVPVLRFSAPCAEAHLEAAARIGPPRNLRLAPPAADSHSSMFVL